MKTKQLPQSWKEVELGDICDVKKGSSITKDKVTSGNVPVIAGGQQPAYYHNISNRTGETLTVSGSGAYAGFVAYFDIPIFASDCSTIQAKSKEVLMKYIYYFLKGNQNKIYKLQKGIAQPHVYPKDLMILKIPLPPLQIQKAIVSILEKAEALKEKRKEAERLTKEYLQSVFFEMFTNNVFSMVKLTNLIIKTENKNPPKEFPEDYFDYIDISSVDNISKRIVSTNRTLGKDAPSRAKQQVKAGDIILSTVRPNLNAVALIPLELDNQICSTGFCVLRLDNNKANSEYIFMNLTNKKFIESMTNIAKGASYPAVSDKDILEFEVPLPPIELQQKFASIVEQVEKLKEKQKESKDKINEMFESLMQKAFNGEL